MQSSSYLRAAAPHIAGVAALMLQSNRDLQPRDIKTILQLTAVDVKNRNDSDRTYTGEEYDFDSGYGLVDAHKAVSMATTYNSSPAFSADGLVSDSVAVHRAQSGAGVTDPISLLIFASVLLLFIRGRNEDYIK